MILGLLIVYFVISLCLVLVSITNLKPKHEYTLPDYKLGDLIIHPERKSLHDTTYWRIKNKDEKWVILLHGWWRDSGRNIKKSQVYWKNGYSILMIDSRAMV